MIILIPILVAVAIFGLVLGLFSGRGEDSDLQDKRMDAIRNVDKDAEDEKKRKEKVKISQRIKNIKNRKQEKNAKISMKKKDDRKKKSNIVDDMLVMVQIDMTSQQFSVLKLCVSCIAMFIAFLLCIRLHVSVKTLLIALLIAGLLGFVLPAEILKSKVKKYQESIRLELPEIMDLLVVSVEAG